jgi:prepilin-type N-terminal cleavage/methylation domain-containing protein
MSVYKNGKIVYSCYVHFSSQLNKARCFVRPSLVPNQKGKVMTTSSCLVHRGFTLIEMLVVLLILALIVVLCLPIVQTCRECARDEKCCTQNN